MRNERRTVRRELQAACIGNPLTDFRSNTPGALWSALQLLLLTTDHVVDPLGGGEGRGTAQEASSFEEARKSLNFRQHA